MAAQTTRRQIKAMKTRYNYTSFSALLLMGIMCAVLCIGKSTGAAQIRISCVGASDVSSPTPYGTPNWPVYLGQLLGSGYVVGNYGASGTTLIKAGSPSYWKTQQFTNSGNSSPDIVIIMLGSNDSKTNNWFYAKTNYVPDYNSLVDHYQNLPTHPRVYLVTLLTVYSNGNFGITDPIVTGIITPWIRQIGASRGLPVFDVNAATKNMPQNFPDNVHPNDAGVHIVTQTILDGLMLGGVAFYQNTSYGGTAGQTLTAGNYTQSQLAALGVPNDWASSARIPIGWTVTMYSADNFTGTSWVLTSDTPDFTTLSPSANDQLSSCKIVSSPGILPNGTYKVIVRHSGLALDVDHQSTTNGSPTEQWTYNGGNNQRWAVTNTGGQYRITGVQSGRALEVAGSSTANGALVDIWDSNSGYNQKWIITPTDSGYYSVINVNSAKPMEVFGGITATNAGAAVDQWSGTQYNQQWSFQAP